MGEKAYSAHTAKECVAKEKRMGCSGREDYCSTNRFALVGCQIGPRLQTWYPHIFQLCLEGSFGTVICRSQPLSSDEMDGWRHG